MAAQPGALSRTTTPDMKGRPMPADPQAAFDRINATTRKLDALSAVAYERAKRDLQRWRNDDADMEQERRDRVRRYDEDCARHQAKYDAAYEKWGMQTPQRVADEYPGDYRRRLFRGLQDRLPIGHKLADMDPGEMDTPLIEAFEPQLLKEVGDEGENPTGSNLPRDVFDPRARRDVFDDSLGRKVTVYKARESFIKSLGRPGRKLAAILHKGEPVWPYIARTLVR
jgi:hypothetical protein